MDTSSDRSLRAAFLDRSVLVTGGLGFIGSNLARWLVEAGAGVTLVDSLIPEFGGNWRNVSDFRDRVQINIADLRDPYALPHLVRGHDYLFNLAGQTSHMDSMRDPLQDLAINVRAQLHLLEACREENPSARIVFASTRQVYGRPRRLPVDETHPTRPVDVNGVHKLAGETHHRIYSEVYGIRSTVLRLTNTYGPGMRIADARQTFLGIWIRAILHDEPFLVFGDGSQLRDFNYVTDVVRALLTAAVSPATVGQLYNLGSDEVVPLLELAEMLVEINGGGEFELVPFPEENRAIDIGDYHGDYTLARDELGWEPTVSLRDGLRRTLDYYRAHGPSYR